MNKIGRSLCRDCKHYIEPTDYCEQNQFELEEKVMEDCPEKELEIDMEKASQKGWKSMKEYLDWILEKQDEDRKNERKV